MNNSLTDARGKIEAYQRKEQAARQLAQQAGAARVAEETRQQAEAQTNAARAALESKRSARLEREALENLSEPERAALTSQVQEIPQRLYTQAREKAESDFANQVERERLEDIKAWQQAHPGTNPAAIRTNAMNEINQRAAEKAQAYLDRRELRELQAERHDDPHHRLVSSLDENGRAIFDKLLDQEPEVLARAKGVKQAVSQQAEAKQQQELYSAFLQEVRDRGAIGNTVHTSNIRAKFRSLGMRD